MGERNLNVSNQSHYHDNTRIIDWESRARKAENRVAEYREFIELLITRYRDLVKVLDDIIEIAERKK